MAVYLGSNQVDLLGGDASVPSGYLKPSGTYNITENGTFDIGSYKSVGVSVYGLEDQLVTRALTTYENSRVSTIGSYVFANYSLTSISFPNCSYIGEGAFFECFNLTSVDFPNCVSIGNSAFGRCSSLTVASFPKLISMGQYTFTSCYNLLSLYLLGSSVVTSFGYGTFNSTPISNYTTSTGGVYGSIYVPASLYNDYITATGWSVYSARIVSLTDTEIAALN